METLALRTARERVESYQHQSAESLARHKEAMECRDCEDHLQLGIEAFQWIERAHQRVQEGVYEGRIVYDPTLDLAITNLYEAWLVPYSVAEEEIRAQLERGYQPENLSQFRACCEEARDRVEQRSLTHIAWTAHTDAAISD